MYSLDWLNGALNDVEDGDNLRRTCPHRKS
jgi:hypothetical protein